MGKRIQKGESPIEIACNLRGMDLQKLSDELRISILVMNQYVSGMRRPEYLEIMQMARILDVDAAYLEGHGSELALWDAEAGMTVYLPVLLASPENGGILSLVRLENGSFSAVFTRRGKNYLTEASSGVHTLSDLSEAAWHDEFGRPVALD